MSVGVVTAVINAVLIGVVPALSDDVLPPASLSDQPELVELKELIIQLDHRRYHVRTEAETELLNHGAPVVAALLDFKESLGPEGALRCVRILERFLIGTDMPLADDADEALQELQDLGGLIGEQAAIVLERHGRLREERAIARIRALGGDVRNDHDFFMEEIAENLLPPGTRIDPIRRPKTIWLYPEWSGGVEGLALLRRFGHLHGMVVYQIRGNELSVFDVQPLLGDLPGADVVERGPACLGIQCGAFEPCMIQRVTPGGAAENGGLMQGDTITAIDNTRVRSFNNLIDELSYYDPGDVITLTVERRYRPEDIEITLSHWRDINEAMTPTDERQRP